MRARVEKIHHRAGAQSGQTQNAAGKYTERNGFGSDSRRDGLL